MSTSHQAVIFNVQRFSIHDGPGIRTTVFFKGCPLRCKWCQNPESLDRRPELAFYADRCRKTGSCIESCPQAALSLKPEHVDRQRCDACGECVDRCPWGALQVIGRTVSLDDLMAQILRDRPFYRSSGGGVTLSGGEATLQLSFTVELARRCREAGIGVVLQTCGAFSWDAIAPHLDLFELVHYDLKVIDADRHRRLAGADNRIILDNARRLAAAEAAVVFRMPIVPGFTADDNNLIAVAGFLNQLGQTSIHLLPYHPMGEIKSQRLGWPLESLGLDDRGLTRSRLARAVDLFEGEGLTVHHSDR